MFFLHTILSYCFLTIIPFDRDKQGNETNKHGIENFFHSSRGEYEVNSPILFALEVISRVYTRTDHRFRRKADHAPAR